MPEILETIDVRLSDFKNRDIALEELIVSQTLSRELNGYSILSPPAVAARQLQIQGKTVERGQRIRFIFIRQGPGVHAWDLPNDPDPRKVDVPKYTKLLFRAAYEVLQPLGITEGVLKDWMLNKASYVLPADLSYPSRQLSKQERPLFGDLRYLRVGKF